MDDIFKANVEYMIRNVPADADIIPGHGHVPSLEGLKTFHHMMKEACEFIKLQDNNGLKWNVVKKVGLPGAWGAVGVGDSYQS